MYLFIEKELRGGISFIAKRHAKANNKCTRDYDPKKLSAFITYLDMNNLYAQAMSECLAYSEFEWLKNIDEFDVMSCYIYIGKCDKKRIKMIIKILL